MQLFLLSGSKKLLWSEIERFSALNMQLFFLWRSKRPFLVTKRGETSLKNAVWLFENLGNAAKLKNGFLEISECRKGHKTRRNKPEELDLAF